MIQNNNFSEKNTTNIKYPDRIDIHEHKVPTDDSIRFLNEMQRKAELDIVKSFRIEENNLKGVSQLECMG